MPPSYYNSSRFSMARRTTLSFREKFVDALIRDSSLSLQRQSNAEASYQQAATSCQPTNQQIYCPDAEMTDAPIITPFQFDAENAYANSPASPMITSPEPMCWEPAAYSPVPSPMDIDTPTKPRPSAQAFNTSPCVPYHSNPFASRVDASKCGPLQQFSTLGQPRAPNPTSATFGTTSRRRDSQSSCSDRPGGLKGRKPNDKRAQAQRRRRFNLNKRRLSQEQYDCQRSPDSDMMDMDPPVSAFQLGLTRQ